MDAVHNGLDRMVRQSDLRDIYHGVYVTGFSTIKSGNFNETIIAADRRHMPMPEGEIVIGDFYLQLSDNTDGRRLLDVFKKYLRGSNYSLGGTDLYTAAAIVDYMNAFGMF